MAASTCLTTFDGFRLVPSVSAILVTSLVNSLVDFSTCVFVSGFSLGASSLIFFSSCSIVSRPVLALVTEPTLSGSDLRPSTCFSIAERDLQTSALAFSNFSDSDSPHPASSSAHGAAARTRTSRVSLAALVMEFPFGLRLSVELVGRPPRQPVRPAMPSRSRTSPMTAISTAPILVALRVSQPRTR